MSLAFGVQSTGNEERKEKVGSRIKESPFISMRNYVCAPSTDILHTNKNKDLPIPPAFLKLNKGLR